MIPKIDYRNQIIERDLNITINGFGRRFIYFKWHRVVMLRNLLHVSKHVTC